MIATISNYWVKEKKKHNYFTKRFYDLSGKTETFRKTQSMI